MYIYVCVCVCVCVYTHTHIYINIYYRTLEMPGESLVSYKKNLAVYGSIVVVPSARTHIP